MSDDSLADASPVRPTRKAARREKSTGGRVASRTTFLFGGFEAMPAQAHRDRFVRAAQRVAPIFDFEVEIKPQADDSRLQVEARGADWKTDNQVVFCDWSDIIAAYGERLAIVRYLDGLLALFQLIIDGTARRYVKASRGYGVFVAFPLLIALGCPLAGLPVALLCAIFLGWPAGLALGAAVSIVLSVSQFRRFTIFFVLDNWSLARDLARGPKGRMQAKIEEHAGLIASEARKGLADEIVIVGYSLGAVFAIFALSKALAQLAPDQPIHLLTLGSSALKVGLQPSANAYRQAAREVVCEAKLPWTDCQSQQDVINFCVDDPGALMGLPPGMASVQRIDFTAQFVPETYAGFSHDIFRVHRQFVLAVDLRNPFSFHRLVLGPEPVTRFAATGAVEPDQAS